MSTRTEKIEDYCNFMAGLPGYIGRHNNPLNKFSLKKGLRNFKNAAKNHDLLEEAPITEPDEMPPD